VDAPANRLTWRLRRLERHGIENLRFGPHTVSLVCEARASERDACRIRVESDGAFELVLDLPGRTLHRRTGRGVTAFAASAGRRT